MKPEAEINEWLAEMEGEEEYKVALFASGVHPNDPRFGSMLMSDLIATRAIIRALRWVLSKVK